MSHAFPGIPSRVPPLTSLRRSGGLGLSLILAPIRALIPTLVLVLVLALGLVACGDDGGPTGPDTSQLEILILSGDGQIAETGSALPLPLAVRVQAVSNGRVEEGVEVHWEVVEGMGARVDQETTVTDSAGVTSVRLTLGSTLGDYGVRASVLGMVSPPAEFSARAILAPELTLVPTEVVRGGEVIRIEGRNLSEEPLDNVVTFSNVRGRVLSASSTALEVAVPPCLPSRTVRLQIRIGSLATGEASLEVMEGGEPLRLQVGEDLILDAVDALACFRLPPVEGTRYLMVPHTTGTVSGAEYPVLVTGLTSDGLFQSPISPPWAQPRVPEAMASPGQDGPVPPAHWEWEARLRRMEVALVRSRGGGGGVGSPEKPSLGPAPEAAVEVGDTRKFKVLNQEKKFDNITARVQYLTDHTLIYVDEETPTGGFTQDDLAFFATEFETLIHPTVTGAFGSESDLDANQRVVILFTPGVNRLTSSGIDGYVAGFFFGLDLFPERSGSNGGEIFYAVVPDPTGAHGPVLRRTTLRDVLPAILAHEFQHMVHFNQRVLVAGAPEQDALWLSEAMAQMAEDLVGMVCQEGGDAEKARDYQLGNWGRARRFLLDPAHVSVLTTLPPGTLAERGAGWLLLKHLYGREGEGELLRALTASKRTGVENVGFSTGRSWPDIVSDWVGSLYLDGVAVPVRSGLTVLGVNLREVLSGTGGAYPLDPSGAGGSSFSMLGSLWPSAPAYYILRPEGPGGLAVNVSGPHGRPADSASGLKILLVRLQ